MTAGPPRFKCEAYPVSKVGQEDKSIPMLPQEDAGPPSHQDLVFSTISDGTASQLNWKGRCLHQSRYKRASAKIHQHQIINAVQLLFKYYLAV